jgi:small subunit ribosomal protein S20
MAKSKAVRVAEKRQERNKAVRTFTKTRMSKAEKLIATRDIEPAREAVKEAQSALDRAVKKGLIHINKASRHKSRLMNRLNQIEGGS